MRPELAITASHLSKEYRILDRGEHAYTAAEAALAWIRDPRQHRRRRTLRALDDVSFDIPRGAAVGIVGRNGAGKSTLLKVITRITAPTHGRVELAGRVGSLLEVGTGFHPELTGRENVYLNGTLLGMRRREIDGRFDEIVDFAGVAPFLDTQVKKYSTGMYIRLAFGVAAHLESEILIVDEVLAVGDADFQAKCLRKMHDLSTTGRTVLLVSHQIQTITALATEAMYLHQGKLLYQGDVTTALDEYRKSFGGSAAPDTLDAAMRPGSGVARFERVSPSKPAFDPDEEKLIHFSLTADGELRVPIHVRAHLYDDDRTMVVQCDSRLTNLFVDRTGPSKGTLRLRSPWLKPGRYSLDVVLATATDVVDEWTNAADFEVVSQLPYPGAAPRGATAQAPVLADFSFEVE